MYHSQHQCGSLEENLSECIERREAAIKINLQFGTSDKT